MSSDWDRSEIVPLIDDTNAMRWAAEFSQQFGIFPKRGEIPADEIAAQWQVGVMIGWFANAIETGRRHHPAQVEADRIAVAKAIGEAQ